MRDALKQAARGEVRSVGDPVALLQQAELARRQQRLLGGALLGGSLLIVAALLWTLAPQQGVWSPLVAGVAGLLAFAITWPRRR